jgi:hypothetical protein
MIGDLEVERRSGLQWFDLRSQLYEDSQLVKKLFRGTNL